MPIYRRLAMLGLVAFFASLYRRGIHFDDPWFLDQAWFIASEGRLKTQLFAHFLGWDQWIYVSQKAHVYFTALFVAGLGPTAIAARLPALVYGLGLLWVLWQYGRQTLTHQAVWLVVAIVLGHRAFAGTAFICRADLALAALGFGSFLALTRGQTLRAGALAGASAVFHLNGVVFMAAGALTILWQDRTVGRALRFSLVALLAMTPVVWDVLLRDDWNVLLYQFRHDPATGGSLSMAAKLANVALVHRMFFHTAVHAALTVWVLVSLGVMWRRASEKHALLLPYAAALLLCFLLLLNRVTPHYYVLFLPFFAVIIGAAHQIPSRLWRLTGAIFAIIACGSMAELIHANVTGLDAEMRTDRILATLATPPRRIIGPSSMLVGHAASFEITGLFSYSLYDPARPEAWTLAALFEDAAARDVDYVIFDSLAQFAAIAPLPPPPSRFRDYELATWVDQFFVYKRRAAPFRALQLY